MTPTATIAITSFVKTPGETLRGESVELTVSEHSDPYELTAYEELLSDAVCGLSARFARQDYVEEAWRIVEPALEKETPVFEYDTGTWSPVEADSVMPPGGWMNPPAG